MGLGGRRAARGAPGWLLQRRLGRDGEHRRRGGREGADAAHATRLLCCFVGVQPRSLGMGDHLACNRDAAGPRHGGVSRRCCSSCRDALPAEAHLLHSNAWEACCGRRAIGHGAGGADGGRGRCEEGQAAARLEERLIAPGHHLPKRPQVHGHSAACVVCRGPGLARGLKIGPSAAAAAALRGLARLQQGDVHRAHGRHVFVARGARLCGCVGGIVVLGWSLWLRPAEEGQGRRGRGGGIGDVAQLGEAAAEVALAGLGGEGALKRGWHLHALLLRRRDVGLLPGHLDRQPALAPSLA
mmetsp:Transcript_6598/g.24494  ORF Transcript_6598/g.24494 Transcript_6598/m.24494 type:complete len:298 (+) Transcript_6598:2010-2903(+)